MANLALQAVRLLLVFTLITGVAYPVFVTSVAQSLMGAKANGSLIERSGRIVGSRLVGQPFSDPRHFWSRPSATFPMPYNAAASAGSNQGPTNPALREAVQIRVQALRDAGSNIAEPVPVDLVTASASGLDPHISPDAAEYQVARVASQRGMPENHVRALVAQHTEGRQFGILGEPRVNVLALNWALEGTDGLRRK